MTSINIGLIYGSARKGRFCDTVVAWVADELAARSRFRVDCIDPAQLGLSWNGATHSDAAEVLRARIARADAFVVVTPEYNHGYPAALKQLIDQAHEEWQAKPVAFVSYGGASGGLRAVEQLRLVFAELHVVAIRDGVTLPNAHALFSASGQLISRDRPKRAISIMLDRLVWWADALGTARRSKPYGTKVA